MSGCKPRTVCALILLATLVGGAHSASCCLRFTRSRLHCGRLLGYTLQTINTSCDLNAVIFHLPGRFVCADPAKHRTVRAMQCVDQKMRRARGNMELSTNATVAAA